MADEINSLIKAFVRRIITKGGIQITISTSNKLRFIINPGIVKVCKWLKINDKR